MNFNKNRDWFKLAFKILFFTSINILLFIEVGCSKSEICLSNQHAVQVGFLSKLATSEKDTTVDSLTIYGVNFEEDSVYQNQKLSSAFLPLSFSSDTTAFVIQKGTVKDTLLFVHSKELDFVSGECGYIFKFNIHEIYFTGNYIDSIAIAYPILKYNEDIRNVKIYID